MSGVVFLCGAYNIAFAIFHILFWKIFKWKNDLTKLSHANRGIMQISNIQLVCFFLIVACTCFIFPNELTSTRFGKVFLVGNSVFWIIRAINQFIFLRIKHFVIHILTLVFLAGHSFFYCQL